ncbi:hypothetical protein CG709_09390 [Lachnotalea glycerini]|nr:hypothetical protein CG709_09390 [Lachnotalea glycerini]
MLNSNPRFNLEDTKIKVLSNKADSYKEGMASYDRLNLVVGKFLKLNISLLGIIPNDENVRKAIIRQRPVSLLNPTSRASKAYEDIAKVIVNDKDERKGKKGIASLFSELLKTKARR